MSAQPASRAIPRNRSGRITVPTASESGSTRPCGRHQSTLAVAKKVWTGSPAVRVSSTRSSMTITVPPAATARRAAAIAATGCAMSCTHSKKSDQVVAPVAVPAGGVDDVEGDPVGDSGVRGVAAGPADRLLVGVVPVDVQVRVRLGQLDRGPAQAAADVGDPRRTTAVAEQRLDVGDLRDPLGDQLVDEGGPVQRRLRLDRVRAVGRVGHAGAGAERRRAARASPRKPPARRAASPPR